MTDGITHEDSTVVAVDPRTLYDLVSDVTRTGEWSPICRRCEWDDGDAPDGDGPRVGARFTGYNETSQRTWQTRSRVVAADPGREFAWVVGENYVRWGYLLEPVEGGTRLTETWHFRPEGLAMFAERYGDDAQEQIAERTRAAHAGIPATLAALKRIAEQRAG